MVARHALDAARLRAPARRLDGARRHRRHRPPAAVEAGAGPHADRAAERVRRPHRRRRARRPLRDRRRDRLAGRARAPRLPRQPEAAGQAGAGRAAHDQCLRPAPADLPAPRRAVAASRAGMRRTGSWSASRSASPTSSGCSSPSSASPAPGTARCRSPTSWRSPPSATASRRCAVFAILAVAASGADPIANPRAAFVRRWLASLGNLGRPLGGEDEQTSLRHETPLRDVRDECRDGGHRRRPRRRRAPSAELSRCAAGAP